MVVLMVMELMLYMQNCDGYDDADGDDDDDDGAGDGNGHGDCHVHGDRHGDGDVYGDCDVASMATLVRAGSLLEPLCAWLGARCFVLKCVCFT